VKIRVASMVLAVLLWGRSESSGGSCDQIRELHRTAQELLWLWSSPFRRCSTETGQHRPLQATGQLVGVPSEFDSGC
jgi:hypothetical protein